MRLPIVSVLACLVGLVAGGAQAATPSVLRLALPPAGDVSVVVIWSPHGAPSLVLPSPGSLGPDIVVAVARGKARGGRLTLVAFGRRVTAEPARARTIVLAWRGGGQASAQVAVGAAVPPARFCAVEAALLATTRRTTWRASALGAVPAARLAGTAVRAACAKRAAAARTALRALLDVPPAAAGSPGSTVGVPPSRGWPEAPAPPKAPSPASPPPSPPGQASPTPVLDLALSYRHAPSGSYVCVDYATSAGARVELRLTGPSQYASVTTIPAARATGSVAVEVFEAGAYAVAGTAASGGLVARAAGAIEVLSAQGAGDCGP